MRDVRRDPKMELQINRTPWLFHLFYRILYKFMLEQGCKIRLFTQKVVTVWNVSCSSFFVTLGVCSAKVGYAGVAPEGVLK